MSSDAVAAASLEDAVAAFFRAARRARGRANQKTDAAGMSLSQFQLVEPLLAAPATVGALAEAGGVATATASRMLEGLGRRGFVARRAQAGDRRTVLLELTEAGREAALERRGAVEDARRRIAGAFDAGERPVVTDLLLRLAAVVEEL